MYTLEYIISHQAREDVSKFYKKNNIKYDKESLLENRIPKSLYKYRSISEYSVDDIINNKITMTSPTEFNDIYDSTVHTDYSRILESNIKKSNMLSNKLGYDDLYTDEMRNNEENHYKNKSQHMMDYFLDDFYVDSYTKDFRNILMWSHYSDESAGICIEYNFNKANKKIQNSIYKSTYVTKPINVAELIDSKENNKIAMAILISIISKDNNWKYEKEWRIVTHLMGENKRIPFINIPTPEKIYFGNRFKNKYNEEKSKNSNKYKLMEKLLSYIDSNNIKIKIAKRNSNSYNLNYSFTPKKNIHVDNF